MILSISAETGSPDSPDKRAISMDGIRRGAMSPSFSSLASLRSVAHPLANDRGTVEHGRLDAEIAVVLLLVPQGNAVGGEVVP
jgi:hypothetical protein